MRAVDNLPTVAPYHELVGGTRPTDSPFFGPFMKHLIGKQFARDADMNEVVVSMLDSWHQVLLCQDKNLGAMVGQMLKCYWKPREGQMCTMCVTSDAHVYVQNEGATISVLVTLFWAISCSIL